MQNNTFSTLFVGQNLIKLLAVDSTNNFLRNLMSKSEPLPEGTVIMADDQFLGRGQLNNIWHAEPGKNLTISILLNPSFLKVDQQFLLNMAISFSIYNALKPFVPNGISIKWPNDIYYFDKKLGGVLIENSIRGKVITSAIVGIGLNINQQHFKSELGDKATSLYQILQQDVKLDLILAEICSQIEKSYLQLKSGGNTFLKDAYVDKLYKMDRPSLYRQNGEVFEGIIKGVTDSGMLVMERNGEIIQFNLKEVEFLTHK